MKIDAAKLELIEWLMKIEDKALLSSLLFYKKSSQSADWSDKLTPAQQKAIDEGLNDIKEGRIASHQKVMAKYGRKTKH